MSTCQRCGSERILIAQSWGRDCHNWSIGDKKGEGYMPHDMGFGGGDAMNIVVCLDCGQAQGKFPIPQTEFEQE